MAHEVETMFYVGRETPWHGMGVSVEEAPTSADAIKYAGLDWKVSKEKVFTESGIEIPGFLATTRDTDGKVYGMVTNKYHVVQNDEAFAFADELLGEGLTYETAGSLFEGKKIWLLAKMPERFILGDKVETYCVLTNSHDGKNAVQVACTPIRVVCNNTLNLALDKASRMWSTRHIGDVNGKVADARETLQLADAYMKALNEEAEKMATMKLTSNDLTTILTTMFPVDDSFTDRKNRNSLDCRVDFMDYYNRDDVKPFKNTLYGAVLAATDYFDHREPGRQTMNYNESRFNNIITGYNDLDKFVAMAKAVAC